MMNCKKLHKTYRKQCRKQCKWSDHSIHSCAPPVTRPTTIPNCPPVAAPTTISNPPPAVDIAVTTATAPVPASPAPAAFCLHSSCCQACLYAPYQAQMHEKGQLTALVASCVCSFHLARSCFQRMHWIHFQELVFRVPSAEQWILWWPFHWNLVTDTAMW